MTSPELFPGQISEKEKKDMGRSEEASTPTRRGSKRRMDETMLTIFFDIVPKTRFSNVIFKCQSPRFLCTEEHSFLLSRGIIKSFEKGLDKTYRRVKLKGTTL
jgi:hypothetical protein